MLTLPASHVSAVNIRILSSIPDKLTAPDVKLGTAASERDTLPKAAQVFVEGSVRTSKIAPLSMLVALIACDIAKQSVKLLTPDAPAFCI